MPLKWMFLLLMPPLAALGLVLYRRDYRQHGRSTALGISALLVGWLMAHCLLGSSMPMVWAPKTPLQYAGTAVMVLGLGLALFSLFHFRSFEMMLGRDTNALVTSGPYRFSRNPQYVFYGLFLLGYAMMGRAVLAYVAVASFWVMLHFTILIEEEHLERAFGEQYRRYKAVTPRYFGSWQ